MDRGNGNEKHYDESGKSGLPRPIQAGTPEAKPEPDGHPTRPKR